MKYFVLGTGVLATAWFVYSFYVFFRKPEQFRIVASGFLLMAAVIFILILIRTIRERNQKK